MRRISAGSGYYVIRAIAGWWMALVSTGFAAESEEPAFSLQSGDVVALLGGENLIRAQRAGHLESWLTLTFAQDGATPRFRDLAWEGDTVSVQSTIQERWREEKYGRWPEQLREVGANVVIAQYGKLESLAGPEGLPEFVEAYVRLIEQWRRRTERIVLVSPIAFEAFGSSLLPDADHRNRDLARYVKATAELARERDLPFVDLFEITSAYARTGNRLTANGLHVLPEKQREWTRLFVRAASLDASGFDVAEPESFSFLREAVVEKHRLWYRYWRPANWKCLFGDDGRRVFGQASGGYPSFREEWSRYPALIERAEKRIAQLAAGAAPEAAIAVAPALTGWSNIRGAASSLEDALDRFRTLDGLEVNLFASEREKLVNPLAMRWDADGNLYVACSTAYPQPEPGEAPNDYVVVLRDDDGDGTADRHQIFAEGLNIPTGLEIAPEGLYVGQGTELLLLRDTDGDGRADERRVVLSGFGNGDTHQTSNSFVWSPGGELWWCQGDGIESRVETPWGVSRLFQAGVFRFRPERLELAGLLDDFMGPGNPWGVAFDDWGQALVIDGAGGVSFLTPAMIPSSHRLRLPTIGRPGGYCGIDVVSGPQFPESLQGDFLIGDYKPNAVGRFSLRRDGAGYEVVWEDPILVSSDERFRPVDVKVGADGAVYVCDWFNSVICHQDDSYRHPDRDKAHGRIWRVAVTGANHRRSPRLSQVGIDRLVPQLGSRDRWLRERSKRELVRRDRNSAVAGLEAWTRSLSPDSEFSRLQALMTFESLETVNRSLLRECLGADDPRIRAYAARLAGRWSDRLEEPLKLLEDAVRDSDPLVRLEAVLACGNIPGAESVVVAARALALPTDRWIDYAFTQAVRHLEPHWLPALIAGRLDFGDRHRELLGVVKTARSRNIADAVAELARDREGRMDPQSRNIARQTLATIGDDEQLAWLLRSVATPKSSAREDRLPVLEALFRAEHERPQGEVDRYFATLLHQGTEQERSAAMRLAGQWRLAAYYSEILEVAGDPEAATGLRLAALRCLPELATPKNRTSLSKRLLTLIRESGTDAGEVAAAALEGLAKLDVAEAARVAVERFGSGDSVREDAAWFDIFLARDGGSQALAAVLESAGISRERARVLLNVLVARGRSDPGLTRVLRGAAGTTVEEIPYSEAYVRQLADEINRWGDPEAGELVFRSSAANCYTCHQIAGVGGELGPDLSAAGTSIPLERLIEEVVWPTRQVKEGYALIQIATTSGELIQGYERTERDRRNELVLETFGFRERVDIPEDRIRSRTEIGSIMPPTTAEQLTRAQLRDLIRFLAALGSPGPFAARDRGFVRHWEASADPAGDDWSVVYGRVAGHLDLSEAMAAVESDRFVWLRTQLAPRADQGRNLEIKGGQPLKIWLDGEIVPSGPIVRIPPGERELLLRIDTRQRKANRLTVRWVRF